MVGLGKQCPNGHAPGDVKGAAVVSEERLHGGGDFAGTAYPTTEKRVVPPPLMLVFVLVVAVVVAER